MAKSSTELTQSWFEAVDTIVGERISSLPYDQTIVCQILDATDHANGIYVVTHNYNTKFTAYADFTGYNVNDYVYVRIPEGDYTKQKVITGKFLEGFIISGETQNIIASPGQNFLLYDKDNQIHSFRQTQIEREINFTYFNSTKLEEKWKNVLALYMGNEMNYERANAIKLVINSEKDIIVYIYKYTEDDGVTYHFAAEQYGVTSPTFMPSIDNKPTYIDVSLYQAVDKENDVFDNNKTYFRQIGNKYVKAEITDFSANQTYYYINGISKKIPIGTTLWQQTEENKYEEIEIEEITDDTTGITQKQYNYNSNIPIFYYSCGYIELQIPSSISMITSARLYYDEEAATEEHDSSINGMFHLAYTIAPELNIKQTEIPITISYCPMDQSHNVSATTHIRFGYLTELDEEINIKLQLVKKENNKESLVPAILISEEESTAEYYLRALVQDKNGDKVDNSDFIYRWRHNNELLSAQENVPLGYCLLNSHVSLTTMPSSPVIYTLEIGHQNNNSFITYQSFYYPLAFTISDVYYANVPTVITYNAAGTIPEYYNGKIALRQYSSEPVDYNEILQDEEHNLYQIKNDIMAVYNIYEGYDTPSFLAFAKNNVIWWYQSLLFTQKKANQYILAQKFPKASSSETRISGALAAQSTGQAGLVLQYNNATLSLKGYNDEYTVKGVTGNPIFHLDSKGYLSIGYDNFTMTGHITGGARYLENSEQRKYNIGNDRTPIYFENGIPAAMPQLLETGQDKIISNYNTSTITTYNSNNNLNSYNGRLISCTSNTTITLPNNSNLDTGLEFEVYKNSNNANVIITFSSSGNYLYSIDSPNGTNKLQLSEPRGVVAIKRISATHWLLTGSVESV